MKLLTPLLSSFIVASTLFLFPSLVLAQAGSGFGLGVEVGDPHSGISFKFVQGGGMALDGALSFALFEYGDFVGHVDGLIQSELGYVANAPMIWYYGIGVTFAFYDGYHRDRYYDDRYDRHDRRNRYYSDRTWIGLRAPLGIAWEFQSVPIDVFLEAALDLWLIEHAGIDFDAAIGIRYWF